MDSPDKLGCLEFDSHFWAHSAVTYEHLGNHEVLKTANITLCFHADIHQLNSSYSLWTPHNTNGV